MFVDQTSLLLALGFAAFALSMTLFVTWLSSRTEWFILIWACGAGVLVTAFACFSIYAVTSQYLLLWVSNMLLSGGFVIFYGAACLFSEHILPGRRLAAVAATVAIALTLPFLVGFDALGAMTGNLVNAALLIATAVKFWEGRREGPTWVGGIIALYGLTALSFIPCAIMIYLKGTLILSAPPSGWAEDVNSIMGLIGLPGIGALSLALNQARIARQHRDEANTDALTGLLNRRAVFERFTARPLEAGFAALVFDLDHFKSINDNHGHAVGDETLKRFGKVMRQNVDDSALVARIGGEEFLVILPRSNENHAADVAEAIRSGFACEVIQAPKGAFHGTVSAGLAVANGPQEAFDDLLRRADDALYNAKNSGRNRVVPSRLERRG